MNNSPGTTDHRSVLMAIRTDSAPRTGAFGFWRKETLPSFSVERNPFGRVQPYVPEDGGKEGRSGVRLLVSVSRTRK